MNVNAVSSALFGFLNVRKPVGKTAHDVVAAVRRITRVKQVGHGGTLDPLAEGVLPVAVGKACRLLRFLGGRKVYLAEIRLGQKTATDDLEGETIAVVSAESLPEEDAVLLELERFRGTITQVPPMYSAIHVDGKRLYQLARAGEVVENIPSREVDVDVLEPLSYEKPVLKVRIGCSAGTYIRSIARDLGDALGCGGCLQSLIREQAGSFRLEDASSLDELKAAAESGRLAELLMAPHTVLPLPSVELTDEQTRRIKLGQQVALPSESVRMEERSAGAQKLIQAVDSHGLVAVCFLMEPCGQAAVSLKPEVVIN